MEINLIGLVLVIIAAGFSLSAMLLSYNQWQRLHADLFKQLSIGFMFLAIMCFAYIFPALFNASHYHDIVLRGQLIFASFGFPFLGFLTKGFEYLKKEPNASRVNGIFILSGATLVTRFLPGQYEIVWNGFGWDQQYGSAVILMSAGLYAIMLSYIIPIFFRIWSRIRDTHRYRKLARTVFIVLFFAAASSGAFMIGASVLHYDYEALAALGHFLFTIFITATVMVMDKLLISYPTIFFASTHDLIELQLLSKETDELVYQISFEQDSKHTDGVRVSGMQKSIRQIFREMLDTPDSVQSIRVQAGEILVYEGVEVIGILHTKKGSDLFKNLLRISVDSFEGIIDSEEEKHNFDGFARKIFQFAISAPPTPYYS